MNNELKLKLLQEELDAQRNLIKKLVEFYDVYQKIFSTTEPLTIHEINHLETNKELIIESIEKDYDLSSYRPKKKEENH